MNNCSAASCLKYPASYSGKFQFNEGADIEAFNKLFEETLLILAARLNKHEAIETLINHGANTEAISNNGKNSTYVRHCV